MGDVRPWIFWLVVIAIVVIAVIVAVRWLVLSQLFVPEGDTTASENESEEAFIAPIDDANARIHLSYKTGFPESPTVLFLHGNDGNIAQRGYARAICRCLRFNLLLGDYRGYGKSSGRPSIPAMRQDAVAFYNYLAARVDPRDIIIWGESLGGLAALHLAAKKSCRKLVLFGAPSGIGDVMAYREDRWSNFLVVFLVNLVVGHCPVREWARQIRCPTLLIHSTEDRVVPYRCAEELCTEFAGRAEILAIKGDHARPRFSEEDISRMLSFLGVEESGTLRRIISRLSEQ